MGDDPTLTSITTLFKREHSSLAVCAFSLINLKHQKLAYRSVREIDYGSQLKAEKKNVAVTKGAKDRNTTELAVLPP